MFTCRCKYRGFLGSLGPCHSPLPSFGNWHCLSGEGMESSQLCQLLLLIDVIVSVLIFT